MLSSLFPIFLLGLQLLAAPLAQAAPTPVGGGSTTHATGSHATGADGMPALNGRKQYTIDDFKPEFFTELNKKVAAESKVKDKFLFFTGTGGDRSVPIKYAESVGMFTVNILKSLYPAALFNEAKTDSNPMKDIYSNPAHQKTLEDNFSRGFAQAAHGKVHVMAPQPFSIGEHSKYPDSYFQRIEWPALKTNKQVTQVRIDVVERLVEQTGKWY
ncbi:hypothetical protein ANO11243_023640 [Dothideomycetidae sp. 11243]|nr:hypothetical protein ANO11243_023640 [fungal sp. No.11243]